MWIPLVIASAVVLGLYDVCKKTSLKENAVLAVMVISSGMSLLPCEETSTLTGSATPMQ